MNELQELSARFLDAEKFFKEIDDLVWKEDITYMEALMDVCDEKSIDPEELIRLKLISPALMSHLQTEGVESGMLKSSAVLPV